MVAQRAGLACALTRCNRRLSRQGGDTISVTRGVVSRVTTLNYDDIKYQPQHSPQLLAVQIDAAINSGNSGG